MISADKQKQQNMVKTLTLTLFSPAQLVIGTFYQLNDVFDENKKLREKIIVSEMENAMFRKKLDTAVVNDVKSDDLSQFEIVSAEIVAREPSFLYRTAIINIGTNHGIKASMPVISNNGVVGKVITALPLTSQIRMLYASDEYISIEHEKSGAVGIFSSKTDGTLFSDMRSVASIDSGDLFITTGLGGIYPRGLKIGFAEKIEKAKGGEVFKRVYINPCVDYDHLRNVFVVKSDPIWEAIKNEIYQYDKIKRTE
jgi:rod shape-determining protein MreC